MVSVQYHAGIILDNHKYSSATSARPGFTGEWTQRAVPALGWRCVTMPRIPFIKRVRLEAEQGSILHLDGLADAAPLRQEEILPSLTQIEDYVRPAMRRRYAKRAFWPPAFEFLSRSEQRRACYAFLRLLGRRYMAGTFQRTAPFMYQLARVKLHRREVPVTPPRHGFRARFAPAVRVITEEQHIPLCMLHEGRRPYLRIALAGRRAGQRSPTMEYAHRVVCWIFYGPPPGGDWGRYQVGHLCGNARCLCPSHLAWITAEEDRVCAAWHRAWGKGRLWPGLSPQAAAARGLA